MDENLGFILVRGDYIGNTKKICKSLNKFEWDLDARKFEVVDDQITFHEGLVRDPTVYLHDWDDEEMGDEFALEYIASKVSAKMKSGSIEIIVCSSDFCGEVRYQSLKIYADGRAERSDEFRDVRRGNASDFETV